MNKIKLKIKLRPIRFLFLVKPSDKKTLEKVFQINTLLWGGKYNPIVPYFQRVPKNWSKYSANQILNNYLDFFEPDFIVETELGMAKNLDFDSKRILKLKDVLNVDEYGLEEKYGLSVYDLYRHLYKKKYQFETRHKVNIVNVKARNKQIQLFSSCIFGSFNKFTQLSYFEDNFKNIFESKDVKLDAISLAKLYSQQCYSPLDIGHVNIDIKYSEPPPQSKLFIFDLSSPKDLIDYWNLRIIYRNVTAIPKQWLNELGEFVNKFASRKYRPLLNEHKYLNQTTVIFSRSISEDEELEIYNNYLIENREKVLLQFWCPDIKVDKSNNIHQLQRSVLAYEETEKDITISEDEDRQIIFDTLTPDFVKDKYHHKPLWVNVIDFEDWWQKNHISTCFPTNYRNPVFPKFGLLREFILPTTEGLTIFPEYSTQFWGLKNGTEIITQWLDALGIKSVVSDAGKSTQQIIETIGGVARLSDLANRNVIEQLHKMANTPLTSSFHIQKFKNKINQNKGRNRADNLVSWKIVQLGLELKCSKCDSWNWYEINKLEYQMSCNRCLKLFDFPITQPAKSSFSRWSYRVIGPFALPDYARGGYAASLVIHFFVRKFTHFPKFKITWSGGQELTFNSGEKAETDFILWGQKEEILGLNKVTDIIFGEAKSFARDAFKEEDIQKMKLIAETFPKSILVFATMKNFEEFSQEEISRLRDFAEWGRGYDNKNKEVRAYIIILTGLELFIDDYRHLANIWRDEGGKYEKFAENMRIHFGDFKLLADMTQQLYLDMPSYIEGRDNINS